MGAHLTLRQADALDKVFDTGELQRGESQTTGNLLYHALVFRRVSLGILVELSLVIALEVADDTTGDELQVALTVGEADERTAIDQWRARDTHMHLFRTVLNKLLGVVAQLCATHDRVVTEHHALVFQQGCVGDKLHLCHQVATALVTRGKRAGPCGCVLQHGTLVGDARAFGIAQSHTNT